MNEDLIKVIEEIKEQIRASELLSDDENAKSFVHTTGVLISRRTAEIILKLLEDKYGKA